MATPEQLVGVLEAWLAEHVIENPDGSNQTKIGEAFGWNGVPWCAETCSVAMKRIGQAGFWTASVAVAINDAKGGKNGLKRIGKNDEIRKGDFVTYDWKGQGNPSDFHIATVVDPHDQQTFQTIGGNEDNSVKKQWRDRTFVSGFIRPAYDNAAPPQGDDMTPDQDQRLKNVESAVARLDGSGIEQVPARVDGIEKQLKAILDKLNAGAGGSAVEYTITGTAKPKT